MVFEEGSIKKLLEEGWATVGRFAASGRDGKTMLYGTIVRPSKTHPSRKYPVLETIYGGPTEFSMPEVFSPV